MFIAKMTTRYPEFHGSGYYNFLMSDDREELEYKIEENSHDFMHVATVKTRHESIENIIKQYPSKQKLNEKYFTEVVA